MENERIAVLENEMRDVKTILQRIEEKQDKQAAALVRYKGFVGGILFAFSSLSVLYSLLKEYFRIKLGG